MAELASSRRRLGESSATWASEKWHLVEEGRWLAFSGVPSVDHNAACCYGSGLDGVECAELVRRTLDDVRTAGVPCVVSLAGAALGSAQVLVDAGWVCVGQQPFMRLAARHVPAVGRNGAVRQLGAGDIREAQAVVSDAFGATASLDLSRLVSKGTTTSSLRWWGVDAGGSLLSVASSSAAGTAAVLRWVGTRQSARHMGHAYRLLTSVHSLLVAEGIEEFLLCSTQSGLPLYERLGYKVLEYLQLWSRPRWVLGRA